jgi:hypothetical protein
MMILGRACAVRSARLRVFTLSLALALYYTATALAAQPPAATGASGTSTAVAATRPAEPSAAVQPPSQPATQAAAVTQVQARNTTYSREAVLLVALLLGLLALLFWFLLKWSHRLDQASYLGRVYRESIEDFEYKRLATVPIEKLQKGEFHLEIERDTEWLASHKRPSPPPGYVPYSDPWNRRPGSASLPGLGGLGSPPGLRRASGPGGPDARIQPTAAESEEAEKFASAVEDYVIRKSSWDQDVENEARARYQRALGATRKRAEERAGYATDVDLSVLRGRGAEFVLEFTTVVVIIFAAIVLGVLDILGTEQIGTLLAAIAGYVLGRATTRASRTETRAVSEPAETKQKSGDAIVQQDVRSQQDFV